MGIIVDAIILICLLSSVLISYRRGLSGSVFRIISFVLAVLITFLLYKPVAKIVMDKTKIDVSIKDSIVEVFNKKEAEDTVDEYEIDDIEEVEDEENKEEDNEIVGDFLEKMKEKAKGSVGEAKNKIIEESAGEIALKIVYIGVGVLLFFAIRIILLVIEFIVSLITKLPVIEQADKLGGIIYGLVEGVIIIFVILAIISFMDVVNIMEPVHKAISESILGNFLYQNNIILKLFIK